MVAGQRGAVQPALDAARAAAAAGRGRPIGAGAGRQRVVAPFAGDRVGAGERLALDHDAAADAGAEDHAEHHRRARGSAVDRLGQREAVGIVGDRHRHRERLREIRAQRPALDPGQVDHAERLAARADHARQRDADRRGRTMGRHQLGRDPGERGEGRGIVARHVLPPATDLATRAVERERCDLAAADVEADADHRPSPPAPVAAATAS